MIWLFDVSVLIAIADPSHIFHDEIHRWMAETKQQTWASCPITENGMVRILSQPAYRGSKRTPDEAIATLRQMKATRPWRHVFWNDDFSITDIDSIISERLIGAKQLTDAYLAALAMRHSACLVTFDSAVAWHAVMGGSPDLILTLGGSVH